MKSILLSLAGSAALLYGGAGLCSTAQAMPFAAADGPAAEITLIADGCGPGFHRGYYGGCRPNGFFGRRYGYGYGGGRYGYRRGYYRNF